MVFGSGAECVKRLILSGLTKMFQIELRFVQGFASIYEQVSFIIFIMQERVWRRFATNRKPTSLSQNNIIRIHCLIVLHSI